MDMPVPTDPARSELMSRIGGKDTKPEVRLRKALHRLGYRYRLHDGGLPGRPDIVFPGRKAVIFVNGCYWHGHGCHLFRLPRTNTEFWRTKIAGNVARDARNLRQLEEMGWRHLTVWECSTRGPGRIGLDAVVKAVMRWLDGEGSSELFGIMH